MEVLIKHFFKEPGCFMNVQVFKYENVSSLKTEYQKKNGYWLVITFENGKEEYFEIDVKPSCYDIVEVK